MLATKRAEFLTTFYYWNWNMSWNYCMSRSSSNFDHKMGAISNPLRYLHSFLIPYHPIPSLNLDSYHTLRFTLYSWMLVSFGLCVGCLLRTKLLYKLILLGCCYTIRITVYYIELCWGAAVLQCIGSLTLNGLYVSLL